MAAEEWADTRMPISLQLFPNNELSRSKQLCHADCIQPRALKLFVFCLSCAYRAAACRWV